MSYRHLSELDSEESIAPNYCVEVESKYFFVDYKEQLVIDRESGHMHYGKSFDLLTRTSQKYLAEDEIIDFLDTLSRFNFSQIKESASIQLENPSELFEYDLTIFWAFGEKEIIKATFDEKGVPVQWTSLIAKLHSFVASFDYTELFDVQIYGRIRRKEGQLIYCKVSFEEDGPLYYYLADEDVYKEGDLVIVPVGPDNREAQAYIRSIEYFSPEKAPYPIEKTKHILGKYESSH
ncbi:MAG: hypothetical protein Q4E22_03680 [Coriobacteriia bacterium]|nr:hypothetical protein [Coriobacteriia bacterium]